jgi:hypothetical protein
MVTLHHHPLCPQSRFVRLFLGEYGIDLELIEERPFDRKHEFLLLDPAGETPVLVEDNGKPTVKSVQRHRSARRNGSLYRKAKVNIPPYPCPSRPRSLYPERQFLRRFAPSLPRSEWLRFIITLSARNRVSSGFF